MSTEPITHSPETEDALRLYRERSARATRVLNEEQGGRDVQESIENARYAAHLILDCFITLDCDDSDALSLERWRWTGYGRFTRLIGSGSTCSTMSGTTTSG